MARPSQITVFTTYPGGDFVLNAESLAALMGESSGSGVIETAITTVGNGTLTAAALVGGQIARTGPTGAYSDATDTAAAIVTALGAPFLAGQTFFVKIKNATQYPQTITGGTGVTLSAISITTPFSVSSYFVTIGGTAASPTATFTHIETVPVRVSGEVANPQTSALATVGAGTILAASFEAGIIARSGTQTAVFSDTTDTAANIIAAVPALAAIGASVKVRYVNNTVFPVTVGGGTGVTVSGVTVIQANSWADFLVTYTAAATLTMVGTAQGSFPVYGTVVANGATPVPVSNTAVTANSIITLTLKTVGGTAHGAFVSSATAGSGFSINSLASDTSTYNYEIRG